ncbi:MAG: hypothetical protein J0H15_13500 [Xanthomonadales bacterium]|nr:hypothetical protein [Xanthomonadales bacterium]
MRPSWILALAAVLLVAACMRPAVRVDGFSEPRPGLVTGGQPDAPALGQFANAGGALVIDLRAAGEPRGYAEAALARELGLGYVNLPIADAGDLTAENAARLHQLLADASGPVLLHCASGNRVGALLAIEAAERGLDPQAALELGRRAGLTTLEPVVRVHLGIGNGTGH